MIRLAMVARRIALRTAAGPLRPLWRGLYWTAARVAIAYLRRGRPETAGYLRGSMAGGEPLYGLADLDLVMVVPADPRRPGAAREGLRRRWLRAAERLPPLRSIVYLMIYEDPELRYAAAATTLTEGLGPGHESGTPAANQRSPASPALAEGSFADEAGLRIRPGLPGAARDWRRLAGPERRPPGQPPPARHLVAWLELQWWWRFCFTACADPRSDHAPYLCLKLFTQPLRAWLWLEHGEEIAGHRAVLERALRLMPDEEPALRRALRLRRELPRSPEPPLRDLLPFLVRTSSRIAERLAADADAAGATAVRLVGDADELVLPGDPLACLARTGLDGERATIRPLADWRARTGRPLWGRDRTVVAPLPDEALALVPGDAGDPATVRGLALASGAVAQPAVAAGPLLVLPAADYLGWIYRGVQCQPSDPVSFALIRGESVADFPELAGWSARDCAQRSVNAHAVWLRHPTSDRPDRPGTVMGLLLGAGRAAAFQASVESGGPCLAVTLQAAARLLNEQRPGIGPLLEEAIGAYRAWRSGAAPPPDGTIRATRALIDDLPAYTE